MLLKERRRRGLDAVVCISRSCHGGTRCRFLGLFNKESKMAPETRATRQSSQQLEQRKCVGDTYREKRRCSESREQKTNPQIGSSSAKEERARGALRKGCYHMAGLRLV